MQDSHNLMPRLFRHLHLAQLSLAVLASPLAHGAIGETEQQSIARYGSPERNALKESGLLYFRKEGVCTIAHFFEGRCDVLSIFNEQDDNGFPKELDEQKIERLLKSDGGAPEWTPAPRVTINGVWRTPDRKAFAIYDTMRHKLVIMTHEAYVREKKAKEELL